MKKIPGPRDSGEWFKTSKQRKCKHPRRHRKSKYLGKLPDPNGRMYKVWLITCGRCGEGLRNKKRRTK